TVHYFRMGGTVPADRTVRGHPARHVRWEAARTSRAGRGPWMKPASFELHRPHTVEEALRPFAEHGDEARPLAGGQSLVPMLALRLARYAHLVDLNGVAELATVDDNDGTTRIGAGV